MTSNEKCLCPSIAVDSDGNAIAIWSNQTYGSIQSARFDGVSKTWLPTVDISELSSVSWFFNSKKHEYDLDTRICMDKSGNAITLWVQKKEGLKVLQAAYYQSSTNIWTKPFDVASRKEIVGFDAYMNTNNNPVILWGEADLYRYICASEYDVNTCKWSYSDKLVAGGNYPNVKANSLDNSVLASLWVPKLALATSNENKGFLNAKDTKTSGGGVVVPLAYDVGIDMRGNITAAWSERYKDALIEKIARYHPACGGYMSYIEYSQEGADKNLGMTAVSVHASGHAAILWDGFDKGIGKHVIYAVIHHAD